MTRTLGVALAFTATALIVACGSGGTGSLPQAGAPSAAPPSPTKKTIGAMLRVMIPHRASLAVRRGARRGPRWISSSTASFEIQVAPSGYPSFPPVTPNVASPACSSDPNTGNTICTFAVQAIPAVVNAFTISAWSGSNASGSQLSAGTLTAQMPAAGQTPPTLSLTLGGVVQSLFVGSLSRTGSPVSAPLYLPIGVTTQVSVVGLDALGEAIIGPMNNVSSISVKSSSSGLLVSPSSITSTSSPSLVEVSYKASAPLYVGAPTSAVTVTASASGVKAATATVYPEGGVFTVAPVPNPFIDEEGTSPAGMAVYGSKLYYAFAGSADGSPEGALGSIDTATGRVGAAQALAGVFPEDLAVDQEGDVWISSLYYGSGGSLECLAAGAAPASTPLPLPTSAWFDPDLIFNPAFIAVDSKNTLWVGSARGGSATFYELGSAGAPCTNTQTPGPAIYLLGESSGESQQEGLAPASQGGAWLDDNADNLFLLQTSNGVGAVPSAEPTAPNDLPSPPGLLASDGSNVWGSFGGADDGTDISLGEIPAGSSQSGLAITGYPLGSANAPTVVALAAQAGGTPSVVRRRPHQSTTTEIALGDYYADALDLFTPSTGTYQTLPLQVCQVDGIGIAIAADGSIYANCVDAATYTQPYIAHAILTSVWSVFPGIVVDAYQESQSEVSIQKAGGTGTQSFTIGSPDGSVIVASSLSFSGGSDSCSTGNCVVQFTPAQAGQGSFSVSDSAGRTQSVVVIAGTPIPDQLRRHRHRRRP